MYMRPPHRGHPQHTTNTAVGRAGDVLLHQCPRYRRHAVVRRRVLWTERCADELKTLKAGNVGVVQSEMSLFANVHTCKELLKRAKPLAGASRWQHVILAEDPASVPTECVISDGRRRARGSPAAAPGQGSL